MSSTIETLRGRLEQFPIDNPSAASPFSARLASENGWSLRHAQRVIREYKRFLYLSTLGESPVCPSEAVDQAWYLHMCYTRSYWDDLCRDVLGRPLHHEPTRGGGEQRNHHRDVYERTLAAYRLTFSEEPPASVWPSVDERFAAHHVQRVDLARHWLIPKPRPTVLGAWLRRRFGAVAMLSVVPMAPVLGAVLNPLEMTGPQFIGFYLALLLLALVGVAVLRFVLRENADGPLPSLDAYDAAVLSGGEDLALRVALSELVFNGAVAVEDDQSHRLRAAQELPAGSHPLVQAMYQGIAGRDDAEMSAALDAGRPQAAVIGARLEDERLLETRQTFAAARWTSLTLMGVVLLVGAAKIAIGMSREKPVAFLVALCGITGFIIYFVVRTPRRTRRGERALRQLRAEHHGLKDRKQLLQQPAETVPMGLSLFGLGALAVAGGELAILGGWWRPASSSGCAGSGCGGDGGGGCGGGCGGCGGGGD